MNKIVKNEIGLYEEQKANEGFYIIEEYKINDCRYRIMYTDDVKANEVFNALNRMIVSGKDKDIQDNIQILKLFGNLISIPLEKKKWWQF